MQTEKILGLLTETHILHSHLLKREVILDFYLPPRFSAAGNMSMLLINDGQDLITMNFENILEELYSNENISPLFCVGIHCSADRKNEYGTAKILDYK